MSQPAMYDRQWWPRLIQMVLVSLREKWADPMYTMMTRVGGLTPEYWTAIQQQVDEWWKLRPRKTA